MTGKLVIVEPHPDDSIIGCFNLLETGRVEEIIAIANDDHDREKEQDNVANSYHVKLTRIHTDELLGVLSKLKPGTPVFVPDPHENHPLHKFVTNSALVISTLDVYFYSTQMDVYYIRESKALSPTGRFKEKRLNECYPSQADMWKYEHKYFLFEGYQKARLTIEDISNMEGIDPAW